MGIQVSSQYTFRRSLKVLSHLSLYSLEPMLGFPYLENPRDTTNTWKCITWNFWDHYLSSWIQPFIHYIHQYINTSVTWLPEHAWAFFAIPDSWSLFLGYIVIFISGLFWRTELSVFALNSIPQEKTLLKSVWLRTQCWEWMRTLHSGNYERGNWECPSHRDCTYPSPSLIREDGGLLIPLEEWN